MSEKAESAEAVIDGHDDDAVLDESRGIVVVAFAGDESASVDPNHHRARTLEIGGTGSEDIQEEAILGDGRSPERRGRLRAVVGKVCGLQRLEPGSMGNWRTPAQIAYGRRGVRNTEEFADARGSDRAANRTAEREDQRALFLRMHDQRHKAKNGGGEKNRKGELLFLTRLHGVSFLTWEKDNVSSVREALLGFRRSVGWSGDGLRIVIVYINFLRLSIWGEGAELTDEQGKAVAAYI